MDGNDSRPDPDDFGGSTGGLDSTGGSGGSGGGTGAGGGERTSPTGGNTGNTGGSAGPGGSTPPDGDTGTPAVFALGDDSFTLEEDGLLAGNVLENDTAPEGGTLSVIGFTGPSHGYLLFPGVFMPPPGGGEFPGGGLAVPLSGDWRPGDFTYEPFEDFFGTDSFTYTVSDGLGNTDTATVSLTVEEYVSSFVNSVSLGIEVDADGDQPAGRVEADRTSAVNLSIALDASGSIGSAQWEQIELAVASALEELGDQLDGTQVQVDVQIIRYADNATEIGRFDLVLDQQSLGDAIANMTFTGGGTNWGSALSLSKDFFDAQPEGEINLVYFVTNGVPSDTWQPARNALTSAGYKVDIQTFGIGSNYSTTALQDLDSDGAPTAVADGSGLTEAFQSSPLFAAQLQNFTLSIEVDGEESDTYSPEVTLDGLSFDYALADDPELGFLLGEENIFIAIATFDLDGDFSTTEDGDHFQADDRADVRGWQRQRPVPRVGLRRYDQRWRRQRHALGFRRQRHHHGWRGRRHNLGRFGREHHLRRFR